MTLNQYTDKSINKQSYRRYDMADSDKTIENETVECEICLKEVPKSGAKSVETSEYVHHFCGVDCYAQWQKQEEEKD